MEATVDDVFDYNDRFYTEEYEECQDQKSYLGFVLYPDSNGEFLLDTRLEPQTFYQFKYELIQEFGKLPNDPSHIQYGELEIVQVYIVDHKYTVVIKTFWLRILQRKWKQYIREKNNLVECIKKNILRYLTLKTYTGSVSAQKILRM